MERKCPKGTYRVRYGLDFPHSVPVEGKDMDQQEPKAVAPMPGFVTDTKSRFEDCPQMDTGHPLIPVRVARKRKEYQEIEANAFDTMMYDRKRTRQKSRSKEATKPQKGESFKVNTGGGEKKICGSKHVSSAGCPRVPFHLYDGLMKSERVLHIDSEASETSIASSDAGDDKRSGGNTSTLTSNEEGDSRVMNSSLVPHVVETSNRFARYAVPSSDDSVTGIGRQDVTGARQAPSFGHQTSRWKHKKTTADVDVISGSRKNAVSSYSARDRELNRVFGVGLWESHYESSTGERRKATAVDSEFSDEAGSSRDSGGREPDGRMLKAKQACDKHGLSNCSREHQSSSVVTDLCASSDSVSLWLEGGSSLKPYHRFKAGVLTNMTSHANSNEKFTTAVASEKAVHLTCVQEEHYTMSRSQYTSSKSEGTHPASTSSVREPVPPARNLSVGRDDSSSGSGSGWETSKPEPTFVLSSGRLSKTQEAQLGKRPTTIDDDFDQYFAQLML